MARRPKSPPSKMRSQRSLIGRLILGIIKLIAVLLIVSIGWVLLYRFINPPLTATMVSDLVAGRGATREWMPIGRIDRDMVRASIAAEDSKFCSHDGFDLQAIEAAMQRNASGGRIRGGSTISQQTAKNAFLWQGGGYARKAAEAWFTLLIEQLWGKPRIMEVYLNIAETGIGTFGVNAGSQRYYGHDASAMSAAEAARIAAVVPLPKARGAVAPKGFTRRYGNTIVARLGVVGREGLDACVYRGTTAPVNRAPPPSRKAPTLPGSEYERPRAATPPSREIIEALPPAADPPLKETLTDVPEAEPTIAPEPVEDEVAAEPKNVA